MNNNIKKTRFVKTPKINHSFTGERLTCYSGLSLLSSFMEKLEVNKNLDRIFPTKNHNSLKFKTVQLLMLGIFASFTGVSKLNKIKNLSADPLVMFLLGLKKALNKDVLSTRLKSLGQMGALKLHDYFQTQAHFFLKSSKTEHLTLDVDSTVFNVTGNQEGTAKGYSPIKKGAKSYHNLIGFASELRIVLNTWFRTGSAYTSNGVCEFIKEIKARLPIEVKTVFFRADSGYFGGELFTLLEGFSWEYLIKVKLKGLGKILERQNWKTEKDGSDYCSFNHSCGTWDLSRQFYAVRTLKGYKKEEFLGELKLVPIYIYACFYSNIKNTSASKIYNLYKQRSTSETWIEEVKSQALAGKTRTSSFYANEMLWLLNIMAYNIAVMARRKVENFETSEHKTFVDIFVMIAGKIINSGGKMQLKIYEHYYFKKEWLCLERQLI